MHDDPTESSPPDEPGPTETAQPSQEPLGTIGKYRVLERVGEGGFGEVYAAEQTEPVKRRVALKVLKAGMDTREVLARFEAERQALAMMDHPNIAKVLDTGETEQGRPYFVMELVKGEPLTRYCDRERLSTRERLDLFLRVCQAIQHAHQKGVIHRDVKPSNVLVTIVDGKPVPKVIDFGIAKATASSLTEKTLYTMRGQVIGTPAYMSPEQAEMSGLDVDTRTDVYSLGVLLYELLTGRLPFEAETLREAGLDTMRRIIREEEPPKPSTRVSTIGEGAKEAAARRRTDPARWRKALRRELDWIVMKALEKDRNRRYETVNGMAMDVGRYLADQPVMAGPPSAIYRMQKYVKRHRVAVGFAATIFLAVVLGLVQANVQKARIAAARDEAVLAITSLEEMLASVDPTKSGRDVTVRETLDETAKTLGEKFEDQPLVEARLRRTVGNTYYGLGEYGTAEEHLRRAVEIRRSRLGEEDAATFEALGDLAWAYDGQGRYEEAEALFQQALRRRVPGEEDIGIVETMNGLATAYKHLGRFDEAEELYRETLEVSRRVLGAEHERTLTTMGNLSSNYVSQERYNEAEALSREALGVSRRVLGEDHPQTLSCKGTLATVLWGQKRHDEAEAIQRELLETKRRVLGKDHMSTLSSMNSLASALMNLGRQDEAEILYVDALETSRRVFGEDHPQVLVVAGNLAALYWWQERFSEAESLQRETLEIQSRVLGQEHPATLRSRENLAWTYQKLGQPEKATAIFEEVLEVSRRVLGVEHPRTLTTMHNVAKDLHTGGHRDEAEKLFAEIWEISRRALGEEHPTTLHAVTHVSESLRGQGRHEEARSLERESVEICRRVYGDDHRSTNDQRYNVACCAAVDGCRDEAIAYLRDALDHGYDGGSLSWILDDSDLASLRDDPEAVAIAEEMRRRRNEEPSETEAAAAESE